MSIPQCNFRKIMILMNKTADCRRTAQSKSFSAQSRPVKPTCIENFFFELHKYICKLPRALDIIYKNMQ